MVRSVFQREGALAEDGQRAQDASDVPSSDSAAATSLDGAPTSRGAADSDADSRAADSRVAVSYFEREEEIDPKDK